jgi:hypothetical protein
MTDGKPPPHLTDRPVHATPEQAKPEQVHRELDRTQVKAPPPGQRATPGRGPLFRA